MKNKRSSFLSVFMVFFLLFSLMPAGNHVSHATGSEKKLLQTLEVTLDYNTCDLSLDYDFKIYSEKHYPTFSWFHMHFPPGTILRNPLPNNENERKSRLRAIHRDIMSASDIEMSCKTSFAIETPKFEAMPDGSFILSFQISSSLPLSNAKYNVINFKIPKSLGFASPIMEGEYFYKIKSDLEPEWRISEPVKLTDIDPETNKRKTLDISIEPKMVDLAANYEFTVYFDKSPGYTFVSFHFPAGSSIQPPLPDDPSKRLQRLHEMAFAMYNANTEMHCCPHCLTRPFFTFNDDGSFLFRYTFIILECTEYKEWEKVTFVIPEEVGIHTPATPGDHLYQLLTPFEPDWRVSEPVTLEPQDH